MIARERLHPCPEKDDACVNAECHEKGGAHDTHAQEQWNEAVIEESVVHDASAHHDGTYMPNMVTREGGRQGLKIIKWFPEIAVSYGSFPEIAILYRLVHHRGCMYARKQEQTSRVGTSL